MAYKTPGVYVKEISLLPPSVAEVATAVPAFIGYTEIAERKGESLTNVPWRISSLLEYHQYFGGDYAISSIDVVVGTQKENYPVGQVVPDRRFYLYESLRLFFDNGGGKCYIVSVGSYENKPEKGFAQLKAGLKALEKYDEPTMILFPDAVSLESQDTFAALQQGALAQCAKLQDRVGILDLMEGSLEWQTSVDNFRDKIGINNLRYGAAYTPWLYSSYPKTVDFSLFNSKGRVKDSTKADVPLDKLTSDNKLNALVTAANTAIDDQTTLSGKLKTLRGTEKTLPDRFAKLSNAAAAADTADAQAEFKKLMDFVREVAVGIPGWKIAIKGANLSRDLDTYARDKLKTAVRDLIALEKNSDVQALTDRDDAKIQTDYGTNAYDATRWLAEYDLGSPPTGAAVDDIAGTTTDYGTLGAGASPAEILAGAQNVLKGVDKDGKTGGVITLGGVFESLTQFIQDVVDAAAVHVQMAQTTLYDGHPIVGNIVEQIKRELAKVPPSGPMAGVYSFVDRTRGVWKAPANVSVSSVLGPVQPIDFFDQEDLNVDVNAGKSINAIRTFTGKGHIVWGARTLAGNDNEWRYVPVRRFFNMVEESVKKSTGWAVFEPNDASLWAKVKSMIDNYLIQKWRQGALAGAVPEDAFFVKVGLGETMTAQDILEGRLFVEIGMAVVRPAEFIILKFMHKMQES